LYKTAGAERVPTLLMPRASVTGPVPSLDELLRILGRELGGVDGAAIPATRPANARHSEWPVSRE